MAMMGGPPEVRTKFIHYLGRQFELILNADLECAPPEYRQAFLTATSEYCAGLLEMSKQLSISWNMDIEGELGKKLCGWLAALLADDVRPEKPRKRAISGE